MGRIEYVLRRQYVELIKSSLGYVCGCMDMPLMHGMLLFVICGDCIFMQVGLVLLEPDLDMTRHSNAHQKSRHIRDLDS